MQDQEARRSGVVQPRPGQLDLFQLAQTLPAEVVNSALVAGLVRVCAELTVNLLPGEPLWPSVPIMVRHFFPTKLD